MSDNQSSKLDPQKERKKRKCLILKSVQRKRTNRFEVKFFFPWIFLENVSQLGEERQLTLSVVHL